MKSVTSLFTIAALTLATSLFAQEETPSSTEEKASAAVEEAAPAMPTSTPEEKSSATITTSPDAQKKDVSSAAPAAAKKKAAAPAASSSPAKAEATKAAPAKASTGPDKGSADANVKRLENEWEEAVMKKDISFAQARVADDFMGVSSKGKARNKSGLMKEIKGDTDTYTSAKNGRMSVNSYGPNVAVVTGTSKEVGKDKSGKAFTRSFIWTDTWMLRGGRWQCIASHVSLTGQK
jgi:ketosteroid isomerase-like protein